MTADKCVVRVLSVLVLLFMLARFVLFASAQTPTPKIWMNGRPDLWDDFGYRGIHEMTKKGKLIVEAYYGQAPKHSCFQGCSGGGQQGVAEVQRYPADYDGVISGAPANFPTRMWPGETWPACVTHRSEAYGIPGEIEWLKTQERRQAGIPIAPSVLRELQALAKELDVRVELPTS